MLRRTVFRLAATAKSLQDQYASTGSNIKGAGGRSRTSLQVSIDTNKSGAFCELLIPFRDRGINVNQVANRPLSYENPAKYCTIFLDVDAHESDPAMQATLAELRRTWPSVTVAGSWHTPWYPTSELQLDALDQTTLAAGEELQDDPENPHPGFHDKKYRARRRDIVALAKSYKTGDPLPVVNYTPEENGVWTTVFDLLTSLYPTHACAEYNHVFPLMIESGVLSRNKLPQLNDVSKFLRDSTGFIVRPIAGLLSSRDFLNALAFRVFFSTQYIRHHAQPLYTPEPDMVHDIIGHLPLLADPEFANFTHTIGLASLGASDAMLEELSRLYWYTVEFGLCRQGASARACGAGILSSAGELKYSLSGEPELVPWDPFVAAKKPFPITKYQPTYFVANSFRDAQRKLEEWIVQQDKPFYVTYNPHSRSVQSYPKNTWSMLQDQIKRLTLKF